ncbi:MAG: MBL fold metallo-hydrolase [Candidatus Coatesbacteria bacterium]
MIVRFWGVRGSIGCPGKETLRIGGNTACVEIRARDRIIIIDAGTGIFPLGNALMKEHHPLEASLFFTHMHQDHVCGWPFFVPAYVPSTRLRVHGERKLGKDVRGVLSDYMSPPYFPVPLSIMRGRLSFHTVRPGTAVCVSSGVTVRVGRLNHPNGALGYRIEAVERGRRRIVAHCADSEHQSGPDPNIVKLARHADVLVFDAMYTPAEYAAGMRGRGHSTWEVGIATAKAAGVKRLVLFHHDPRHDDAAMARLLREARRRWQGVSIATEGTPLTV